MYAWWSGITAAALGLSVWQAFALRPAPLPSLTAALDDHGGAPPPAAAAAEPAPVPSPPVGDGTRIIQTPALDLVATDAWRHRDLVALVAAAIREEARPSSQAASDPRDRLDEALKGYAQDRQWTLNAVRMVDMLTAAPTRRRMPPAGMIQEPAPSLAPVPKVNLITLTSEHGAWEMSGDRLQRCSSRDRRVQMWVAPEATTTIKLNPLRSGMFWGSRPALAPEQEVVLRSPPDRHRLTFAAEGEDPIVCDLAVAAPSDAEPIIITPTAPPAAPQVVERGLGADGRLSERLVVRASDRFTAVIISATAPLRGRLRVTRSDASGAIGQTCPILPYHVASVDDWASLEIDVQAAEFGETFTYRIACMSAHTPPDAVLVAWSMGGMFGSGDEQQRLPMDGLRDTARWMLSAFGLSADAMNMRGVLDAAPAASPGGR